MKLVRASEVEETVVSYLKGHGFRVQSSGRAVGETGCDVVASRGRIDLFIEVIGFQDHPPTRSKEFYECFFRTISRDGASARRRLVMALPVRFAAGMAQRKQHYGIAWQKIGRTFPNLEIWYVDTEAKTVERRTWEECGL